MVSMNTTINSVINTTKRYGSESAVTKFIKEHTSRIDLMEHPLYLEEVGCEFPFKEYAECYYSIYSVYVPYITGASLDELREVCMKAISEEAILEKGKDSAFKELCRRCIAFTMITANQFRIPYLEVYKDKSYITRVNAESMLNMEIINISKAIKYIHRDILSGMILKMDYEPSSPFS